MKWPMSVIRLEGSDPQRLAELADKILTCWRGYSDESVGVVAFSDGEPHNTITPIARRRGEDFELDLVLRNNITTKEHPLGVYHPHANLHHIKKENIGLIEVMGLAVLPSRLKEEMEQIEQAYIEHRDIRDDENLEKHADWFENIKKERKDLTNATVRSILREEIGNVFSKVLEDAGVYKFTSEGKKHFLRFVETVNRS